MGPYHDFYEEDKSRLENDQPSYEFFLMWVAIGDDFYRMVSKFYKSNLMSGFKICACDDCESLGKWVT